MKKKFLAVLAFALVLSLVLTVAVAASGCEPEPPCPPPPPPPCELYCSPGFWKNHTFWVGDYADGAWMLEVLWAKGNDPLFAQRWDVIDELNSNPDYAWVDCD